MFTSCQVFIFYRVGIYNLIALPEHIGLSGGADPQSFINAHAQTVYFEETSIYRNKSCYRSPAERREIGVSHRTEGQIFFEVNPIPGCELGEWFGFGRWLEITAVRATKPAKLKGRTMRPEGDCIIVREPPKTGSSRATKVISRTVTAMRRSEGGKFCHAATVTAPKCVLLVVLSVEKLKKK